MTMTSEERETLIKSILPDTVNGEKRPADSMPTDMPYSTEFPQLINNDPGSAAVFNLILRQVFSNFKTFANNISNDNKLDKVRFTNGMMLWADMQDDKPVLHVTDIDGNTYKFSDFVLEKSVTFVLLSNGEIYNTAWLQSNPQYVKDKLIDFFGHPLLIVKTFDSDSDVAAIQKLLPELDFDHFWDWSVSISSNKLAVDVSLSALTTGKKIVKKATKGDDSYWTIEGDNAYGEKGYGYGMDYASSDEHDKILLPEHESITNEIGGIYYKVKEPAEVYPDAQDGDIYLLHPPELQWTGLYNTSKNRNDFIGINAWHKVLKYNADSKAWEEADFNTLNNCTSAALQEKARPFHDEEVADIACGKNFTVWLLTDGSVWTAGANNRGQLGAGSKMEKQDLGIIAHPIDVGSFSAIAACEQTWIALGNNGILYACGANSFGQFGQGDKNDRDVLTPIADYVERAELTSGNLIIRKFNGTVYGAGWNYDDRLNLGICKCITTFQKLTEAV